MPKVVGRTAILMTAPALGAVTPLIALPALSVTGGPQAWASIAVGQSIGLVLATLLELGWGLTGPQSTARRTGIARRRLVALSLRTRLLLLPPLALVAVGLSTAIAPADARLTVAASLGSLLTGLTLTWYFIGCDRVAAILWTDSLPRLVLVSISAALMLNGFDPIVYPLVGLAGGSIAAVLIGSWIAKPAWRGTRWSPKRILGIVAQQRHVVTGRGISALYISLPPALLAVVSPNSVALFAAVDRIQRMGLAVLAAIPSALQAKVGQAPPSRRLGEAKKAVALNAIVAAISGLCCFALLPWAAMLIFAGTIIVPTELAAVAGLIVAIVVCSRAVGGLLLVAQRRLHVIATSALAGAIVGVPTVLGLGGIGGAAGALAGQALAEGTVLGVQVAGASKRTVK